MTEIKNPPIRGAIFRRHVVFQRHVAEVCGRPTGLKKMTLRNDDVVQLDMWPDGQPLGVSSPVHTHQWMIKHLLPVKHYS